MKAKGHAAFGAVSGKQHVFDIRVIDPAAEIILGLSDKNSSAAMKRFSGDA
jgi:hypothetical protein